MLVGISPAGRSYNVPRTRFVPPKGVNARNVMGERALRMYALTLSLWDYWTKFQKLAIFKRMTENRGKWGPFGPFRDRLLALSHGEYTNNSRKTGHQGNPRKTQETGGHLGNRRLTPQLRQDPVRTSPRAPEGLRRAGAGHALDPLRGSWGSWGLLGSVVCPGSP